MYGVEIPRHEEHRFFGPLSDWMSGVGTLLVGAVIVTMPWPARSPAGAVIGRGIVAVVSIVAALGSFLLVTGVIGFVSGTILALCGLVAQALWLALIPGRSARVGQIGRRKGATARWLGWAFLSGLVVVSVGFAFSSPALQWTFFIVGGVIGLIGWVGAPLWYLLLGLSAWRH
jgi:hypothetical protein